jgi:hypothetical protein
MLLAAVLMAGAGAPILAAGQGEVQLAAYLGRQNLRVDDDAAIGNDRGERHGVVVGAAVAYRLPRGLLFEVSLLHASYNDFLLGDLFERNIGNYQYSGAVGWQFDKDRWRFTPKVGVVRSKLTTSGPLLFPPDDELTDMVYATAPFIEASAVRRIRGHLALGLFLRETFEDFGHTHSGGATLHYYFD